MTSQDSDPQQTGNLLTDFLLSVQVAWPRGVLQPAAGIPLHREGEEGVGARHGGGTPPQAPLRPAEVRRLAQGARLARLHPGEI